MNYPILMADVIKSSQKASKTLMTQLKSLVSMLNERHKSHILSPLTITLGDEFQGLLESVENGIRLITDAEELIIEKKFNLKLRYVLHYGKIETPINPDVAYEMLGEGLTFARERLLDMKSKNPRFVIQINKYPKLNESQLNKAFFLYQHFADSWKTKDYDLVFLFLQYRDYKIVGEKAKIDRSSAWRREKSLNIQEYITIKEMIDYIITKAT